MRKISFDPTTKHECGLDPIIYDHYMERKLHPVEIPNIGPIIRGMDVGKLRYPDEHPTYELIDLAEHIDEKEYDFGGYRVRWYCPSDVKELSPCIFYIHGGGYFMGSVKRLNNINRRLA